MIRLFKLFVCLLLCIITLYSKISAFAQDVSICHYDEYSSHTIYAHIDGFCSLHSSKHSVTAYIHNSSGNLVSSQSVNITQNIKYVSYVNGNFYIVCYGIPDTNPNGRCVFLYYGSSLNNLKVITADIAKYDDIKLSAVDSHKNVYYVGTYKSEVLNIISNDVTVAKISFDTPVANISQSPSGNTIAFSAGTHIYYYQNGNISSYSNYGVGFNINSLVCLSDSVALCNDNVLISLSDGYIGDIKAPSNDASIAYSNDFTFCGNGKTVYRYDNLNHNVTEINIEGDIIACITNNNKLAVLYSIRGYVYIKVLLESDSNENISSVSESNNTFPTDDVKASDNQTFRYIERSMTFSDLNSTFNNNITECKNYAGKAIKNGNVGTGTIITVKSDNKLLTYQIILTGDISGEGNINSTDIDKLIDVLIDEKSLSNAMSLAADIDRDEKINVVDLLLMQKMIDGTY